MRLRSSTSKSTPSPVVPQREDAVDPVRGEELDVRLEGVLVEDRAAARERRQGSGDGSAEHRVEL